MTDQQAPVAALIWGVTKEQLTAAHRKVGKMTKDIAAELGKRR